MPVRLDESSKVRPLERNSRMRQAILDAPLRIGVERAGLWYEGEELAGDAPPAIRNALALQHLLANVDLVIRDDELIAGNKTRHLLGLPWFIERGDINHILATELGALGKRRTDGVVLDRNDVREIRRLLKKYRKRSALADIYRSLKKEGLLKEPRLPRPREVRDLARGLGLEGLRKNAARWLLPVLRSPRLALTVRRNPEYVGIPLNGAYAILGYQGHLILGHDRIIRKGYSGIAAEAEELASRIDPEDADREEKLRFYEAVGICCRAAQGYALRLASHAEEMASATPDGSRKAELLKMAGSLRQLARGAPGDFRQAVQSVWLSMLILELYHPMSTISVGRLDRMLTPFYEKDLAAGRITPEEARGYLEELFLKIWTCTLYLGPSLQESSSYRFPGYQAVTIGGTDERGEDVTTEVSMLCIDALDAVRPVMDLCVRIHPGSPPQLIDRVVRAISDGVSLAVYNDEVISKSLRRIGVSEEHARDFAIIGCVEHVSASRTGGNTGCGQVNLAALLDMALRNGSMGLPMSRFVSGGGGLVEGDFRLPGDFEELMESFGRQLDHALDEIVRGIGVVDTEYLRRPTPFISMTIDGCLAGGRDITAGGALYDVSAIELTGLANVADSMAAIRKAVYEEGWISLPDLITAMDTNFRGNERLRQRLVNRAPKFGNDDDEADLIARRVMDMAFERILPRKNIRGGQMTPVYLSLALHIIFGQVLGATPDGRLAGTPICNSLSPANGRERNGPTAVLNSIAKIDTTGLSTGSAVNIKFHPSAFAADESKRKLADMMLAYFEKGGPQLQVTMADADTLRDAKKHPEDYPDLVVKVGGFSALFTDLGADVQDEIIERTEHGL
ncbi:MAG: hypothetical protein KKF41_03455 [Actinobacteria bacterium]|nr:hypothetical protein [Actinomycetota bacterium]MBU1945041.1 hypothetical protein [Actinomycetota bacterium]MBU2686623.1 hypothetical protein [Actinomycetota bacterium]